MQLRVNIRKLKQLLWLLCVLALGYAGWTFFDIYSSKQAGEYNPRAKKDFEVILKRDMDSGNRGKHQVVGYQADRFEKLWQVLVNGEVRQTETVAADVPVEPPKPVVPELATVIDLTTVLYDQDPLGRVVAITYKDEAAAVGAAEGNKLRRLHLSEGDPLKSPYDASPYNGKVVSITMQEVKFAWGEGEVTLTPKLGTAGTGLPFNQFAVPEQEDPSATLAEAPKTSVQVKPGHWVIGTEDLARIERDPQSFMAEELKVRTITPPAGGRSFLEVLEDPPAGSLAAEYGVKAKDRLISVNGIPMYSLSAAANWFKANDGLPKYEIVYERAGQQYTTTVYNK